MGLETLAMRNSESGSTGSPFSTLASPYPRASTNLPSLAIAMAAPGTFQRLNRPGMSPSNTSSASEGAVMPSSVADSGPPPSVAAAIVVVVVVVGVPAAAVVAIVVVVVLVS